MGQSTSTAQADVFAGANTGKEVGLLGSE